MMYLGNFDEDTTLDFIWNTNNANGASVTRATDGEVRVYKNNGVSQSTAGVTDTEDFDSLTGIHACTIDLSADAFYEAGADYAIVLQGAIISGQTVNAVIGHFSISNRFAPFRVPISVGDNENDLLLEPAILARLESSTGVTDVFGTRIYPGYAPQGTRLPFITYDRTDAQHASNFLAASGYMDTKIQLDLVTDTMAKLAAGREAVRQRLDGFRGGVTVGADTFIFKRLDLDSEFVDTGGPLAAGDERIYRSSMIFDCDFTVSTPVQST